MEDAEKGEKSERELLSLQNGPGNSQDASYRSTKTDNPRTNFYRIYEREASKYDTEYVRKFDQDLNTTSIFAGLFSAVSTAFVVDIRSDLQGQSSQEDSTSGIATAACLMYASFLISLIVAIVAMLAKQWINQYLWNLSGSRIERCKNRQRKFDGIRKWSPHIFLTYLLWMLQIAVYLHICGLYIHIWDVSTPVAITVLSFLCLVGLTYTAIVGVGSSSYASPFQTPLSSFLRASWHVTASIVHPKRVFSQIRQMSPLLPRQFLSTTTPLENIEVHRPKPWMEPEVLATIRQGNLDDIECVLWILRYTIDPEALDAAIRFAITIRWSDDGTGIDPPCNLIVFIFEECFDSSGKLYPGSRDRAYYSGQAVLWIHIHDTMRKSKGVAMDFPLLSTDRVSPGLDDDLSHLLQVISMAGDPNRCIGQLLKISPRHTSPHLRSISNLLLDYSWANRTKLDYGYILDRISETHETEITIPLEATLNRLLVWCTFLGSPVEEEVLEIQDKFTFMGHILDQLSGAVLSAINGTPIQRGFIPPMLHDLVNLKNHLHVAVKDMDDQSKWAKLLLGIIRTPEGAQRLSQRYWELLVEAAILFPQSLRDGTAYDPQITESLVQAREWRKLECWMAAVWMVWPPGAGGITEEDPGRLMPPLFRQQPGAGQKLEQWMERWSQANHEAIPGFFQEICTRAQEEAQRDAPSIPPTDQGTLEPADSSLPADSSPLARSPSSGGNTFWESLSYCVS